MENKKNFVDDMSALGFRDHSRENVSGDQAQDPTLGQRVKEFGQNTLGTWVGGTIGGLTSYFSGGNIAEGTVNGAFWGTVVHTVGRSLTHELPDTIKYGMGNFDIKDGTQSYLHKLYAVAGVVAVDSGLKLLGIIDK